MNNITLLISQIPATGNVEKSTYVIILVIAGILLAGAIIAGIFTKRKK